MLPSFGTMDDIMQLSKLPQPKTSVGGYFAGDSSCVMSRWIRTILSDQIIDSDGSESKRRIFCGQSDLEPSGKAKLSVVLSKIKDIDIPHYFKEERIPVPNKLAKREAVKIVNYAYKKRNILPSNILADTEGGIYLAYPHQDKELRIKAFNDSTVWVGACRHGEKGYYYNKVTKKEKDITIQLEIVYGKS